MFNKEKTLDIDFSHSEEYCSIQLVRGKIADWPMALIIFSDTRKLVSVASLPKSLVIIKGDIVKLAANVIRLSFKKGILVLA